MTDSLNDTVALVTGASSGIGEATALALSSHGAKVALVARRADRLEALAERIGDGALVIEADVSDQSAAAGAVQRTVDELGRLDTLINNAGVMLLGAIQVADLVNISSVAGRVPRLGSGVYNLTKHGVGAFSESLRQEVTQRHVRVSLVEPGATATELASHNRAEVQEQMAKRFSSMELMQAEDIADAIAYIVTRPRRVAINEVLIRPTDQQA
jgi:NADP-dependent 3-hydroxy acid dehydrogenase YdfG